MEFRILKNIPNLHKKEKGLYITNAISQKDAVQPETNVAMPNDEHVTDAKEFIEANKK